MDQTRSQRESGWDDGTRWQGTASAPPQTNSDAFAANFRALTPALYDFLNRLTGRDEAATALLRQVASQAAMGAASADQWPSARAWLFARAYAALPADTNAATADPAPYITPDPAMLPPVAPESGLADMTRAVWRAISALPIEQHALLHLHTREAMVGGEAASVLGITEREANDRLQRLIPAVEAASRALFLIRFGRPRDAELDNLLSQLNITRLTPEARTQIEEYAERSPTARDMLRAVPPPLAVYAALRPIVPSPTIADEAIAGALPWLPVVDDATTALAAQTTALPEEPTNGYATEALTDVTPTDESWQYGQYSAQEPPQEYYGTRALDIPVRQRVVREEPIYAPPRRTNRAMGPLALLGLLGGALVLIVGALVIFLVRGDSSKSSLSVTATVGGTPTATTGLFSSAAVSLTQTALASTLNTPTPFPIATTAPLPPPVTDVPNSSVTQPTLSSGSAVATSLGSPGALSTAAAATDQVPTLPIFTLAPRVTLIPNETPTPRVTPVPTNTPLPTDTPGPTKATTPVATKAPTAKPTTATTPVATAATTAATAASGGTLTLDKGSISLGGSGNSSAVTLANPGPAAVPYTAKANTNWLSAAPASGSVPPGGNVPVTVTINRAGLSPGTYSGTITFTTPSGSFSTVTVTFTV